MTLFVKPTFFMSPESSSKRQQTETESYDTQEDYGNEDYEEGYDEEHEAAPQNTAALAANQVCVTLSYTLMNQVKQMARMEGVSQQDMILELLTESLTRRSYEDASKPMPSHLMTRSGYLGPDANGNQMTNHYQQQQYGNQNGNRRQHNNNNGNQRRNFNGNGNSNGYNNNKNFNGNGGNNRYNNKNNNRFSPRPQHNSNHQQSQNHAEASLNSDKDKE